MPCKSAFMGRYEIRKPPDPDYEFWVDFNLGSRRITLFCAQEPTEGEAVRISNATNQILIWAKKFVAAKSWVSYGYVIVFSKDVKAKFAVGARRENWYTERSLRAILLCLRVLGNHYRWPEIWSNITLDPVSPRPPDRPPNSALIWCHIHGFRRKICCGTRSLSTQIVSLVIRLWVSTQLSKYKKFS